MFRSFGGVTSSVESTDEHHVSEGVVQNKRCSRSKSSEGLEPRGKDDSMFEDPRPAVSGSIARVPSIHDLPLSQSLSIFFLSMIEERCRKEAARTINCERQPEDALPEDHEDVLALATQLYHGVSQEMAGDVGLPDEVPGSQGVALRKELLSRFDTILRNAARAVSLQGLESPLLSRNQGKPIPNMAVLSLLPSTVAAPQAGGNASESAVMLCGNNSLFGESKSVYHSEYQELGLLGKGGYGEVYRVRNHLDNQEYAVKKIILTSRRLQKSQEKEQIDALLAELRTLAQLNHTNIVRYYHGWLETYARQTQPIKPKEPKLLAATRARNSTWDLSENEYDPTAQELSCAMAFGADHSAYKMYEEALDRDEPDYDGEIMFAYSTWYRSTSYDISSERNSRYIRPISRSTFGASLLSVSEGSNNTEIEDIPRDFLNDSVSLSRAGLPKVAANPVQVQYHVPEHVLFIKMSLHPLTLLSYLSSEEPKLRDAIKTQHCFHLDSSVRILSAILDGVEYLHSQRIIHRDLKPANIFLSLHEKRPSLKGFVDVTACSYCSHFEDKNPVYITPCIGDFGLIAEIEEPTSIESNSPAQPLFRPSRLETLHVKPVGTPLYCPRKMPKNEPIICPKLDVYSLGIIAMELVHKFTTKSERVSVLTNLGKGILPAEFADHPMAEGIKSMVCSDRDKRWDLAAVRQWLDGLQERDIGKGKRVKES